MGCGSSKPSEQGLSGSDQTETWQGNTAHSQGALASNNAKPTVGPTTPRPEPLHLDPTTSTDTSHSSRYSQLSTWDMRTMQGPIPRDSTPTAAPAAATTPLSVTSFRSLLQSKTPGQPSSLRTPSFSQRLRSPSILGIPAIDSPIATATAAATSRLVVTKLGGCTMVNQYLVVQYLGRGTSGKVFLCMDVLDRRLYAVKIVRKVRKDDAMSGETPKASASGDQEQQEQKLDGRTSSGASLVASGSADLANSGNQLKQQSSGNRRRLRRKKRDPLEDLRREIEIMRSTGIHPNIVALREVVDDPTSNKMLIVMEYCEGGPVMTRAGLQRGRRIPENVARPYFRDMVAALGYLHSNRVVHGDLKPENALMCASGRVAVSDFGCSKILPEGTDSVDRCNGTPAFLAPEMMSPGAKFRGRPADVYALGACLFTFVFGRIPFIADSVAELFELVKTTELSFPEVPEASEEVKSLLQALLIKDPNQRMTLEEAAEHRWTTDGGRLPSPLLQQQQQQLMDSQDQPGASGFIISSSPSDDPHVLDGDKALALLVESENVEVATYGPGQWLMRQGERSNAMYYVLKGEVDVLYHPQQETEFVNESISGGNVTALTPAPSGPLSAATSVSDQEVAVAVQSIDKEHEQQQQNQSATPPVVVPKLWSPSARLRRSARDGNASATPFSQIQQQGITSPRLAAALGQGPTPEPSPRPGTGNLSSRDPLASSFTLSLGPSGLPNAIQQAIDSAVTTPQSTPALTPLPSARDSVASAGAAVPPPSSAADAAPNGSPKLSAHPVLLLDSLHDDDNRNGENNNISGAEAGVDEESVEAEEASLRHDDSEGVEVIEVTDFLAEDDDENDKKTATAAESLVQPLNSTTVAAETSAPGDVVLQPQLQVSPPQPTLGVSSSSPSKLRSLTLPPSIPTIQEEVPLIPSQTDVVDSSSYSQNRPSSAASCVPQRSAFSAMSLTSEMSSDGMERPQDDAAAKMHIRSSLSDAAEGAKSFLTTLHKGSGDYLVAVRAAGDYLGETALIGGSSLRRACSVRVSETASEEVQVAIIPYTLAKEHFRKYPLAKQRLAELVWARQSETIVLEGLLKLAGISNELQEQARKPFVDDAADI